MPTTFNWMPPLRLNDGHQAHTTVEISQPEPHEFDDSLQKQSMLTMGFEAYVDFVSDDTDPSTRQTNFRGLEIKDCFIQEDFRGISREISRNFPCFGQLITWTEKHYDEDPTSESMLNSNEVFIRIQKFLRAAIEKECNFGANVVSVELRIRQEIVIPDGKLKAWHLWYAGMEKSDPDFVHEWINEISRPRTEEELMNVIRVPEE